MCSKNFFLVLILTLLSLSACAKKQASDSGPVQVTLKGNNSDCIAKMGTRLTEYSEGKLSNDQVVKFWDCIATAVNDYQTITVGDLQGGNYSPQAIRHFIEHYFIKDHPVPDPLLDSAMQLKRVLLSGTADSISQEELNRLKSFLGELKSLSLQLQPFVPVLFRTQNHATDEEIRNATTALKNALLDLGKWLNDQNQDYSFQQMSMLVDQINLWQSESSAPSTSVGTFQKVLMVLPPAKSIFIGGDKNIIHGGEWAVVANALGKGYAFYLALAYGFSESIDVTLSRGLVPMAISQTADLLRIGVSAHPNNLIPNSEWDELFAAVEKTKWLPESINANGLSAIWEWLLRRPLGDGVTVAEGLTNQHADGLQKLSSDWINLLNFPRTSADPLVKLLNSTIEESAPMHWDSFGRMTYPLDPGVFWSDDSRTHMIWPFVVMNWIKTSYVGDTQNYLDQSDMNLAVSEILPLLQNFGWLESTQETVGVRLLREADLFTLGGNGNLKLDLGEAVRYLTFISSSLRSAQVWLERADQFCGSHEVTCVRSLATQAGSDVLAPMPRLVLQNSTWPAGKFVEYMNHAESTVLGSVKTDKFGVGDLLQVIQLFQYSEVFIQRFDSNFSESISLPESLVAYPIYAPTLGGILSDIGFQGVTDDDLKAFFTFLMKFGQNPFLTPTGPDDYLQWRAAPETWSYESQRDVLMSILDALTKI